MSAVDESILGVPAGPDVVEETRESPRPWYGAPFAAATGWSASTWVLLTVAGAGLAVFGFTILSVAEQNLGHGTLLAWAAVLAVLPALTAIDFATRILPTRIMMPAGAVALSGLVWDWFAGDLSTASLLCGLGTASAMYVGFAAVYIFAPAGAFGFGDVRLFTLTGLVVGAYSIELALNALIIVPSLVGFVTVLTVVTLTRNDRFPLPFGPFILAGFLLAALAPEAVTDLLKPR